MRLTEDQWSTLEHLLPRPKKRVDGKGGPRCPNRSVLEGILWVLKSGARWRDLPEKYPPYQTCHRRFQEWVKQGIMREILRKIVEHLKDKGKINLTETYIDATFVEAKKGVKKSEKPNQVKGARSWQSQTRGLFLSPYPLRVLHIMRVNLLIKRLGLVIQETFLSDLWVTKLTITTHWMLNLQKDMESNLLLPISQIESLEKLKMEDLFEDIGSDGVSKDSFLGYNALEE